MKKTRYFLFPLLVALTFWIILRESSLTQIFDCLANLQPFRVSRGHRLHGRLCALRSGQPAALLVPDRTLATNVRGNSVF